MNATTDLSLLTLIQDASLLVQLVMLLLVAASALSWWYIFRKRFAIARQQRLTDEFEERFWKGGELQLLYQGRTGADGGAMGRVFSAGYEEFVKLRKQTGIDPASMADSTRRAMQATYRREMDALESHLSFIASVGSVSPYIGLFGTVWGIMNSFRGLANVSQATLAHVAPGIAEALVATAMGLFAAIPAVIAYNRFSDDIDRLSIRLESFMEECANILQRQSSRGGRQDAR
ncbi:MAG: protein TolQ [Rhodocyclaceae bacterium]|nr:protein TolQ [Rhodocyclaceae bacterium]